MGFQGMNRLERGCRHRNQAGPWNSVGRFASERKSPSPSAGTRLIRLRTFEMIGLTWVIGDGVPEAQGQRHEPLVKLETSWMSSSSDRFWMTCYLVAAALEFNGQTCPALARAKAFPHGSPLGGGERQCLMSQQRGVRAVNTPERDRACPPSSALHPHYNRVPPASHPPSRLPTHSPTSPRPLAPPRQSIVFVSTQYSASVNDPQVHRGVLLGSTWRWL
jgi:hypothetical protein